MRPSKSLIVCTLPRSGSYMLCDGLTQTGEIGYPAEYFSVAHRTYYDRLIGPERARDHNIVFDYALRMGTTPNGVFSAKILFHQLATVKEDFTRSGSYLDLAPMQIIDRLTVDPHYVYLVRRDKLRQAISYLRAIQSGIWWDFGGRSGKGAPEPKYDHAAIFYWIRAMTEWETAWVQELGRLDRPMLSLDYDDTIADYAGTMSRVYDLLGIPQKPETHAIRPTLQKQSDKTTDAWVERFRAIEAKAPNAEWRRLELT